MMTLRHSPVQVPLRFPHNNLQTSCPQPYAPDASKALTSGALTMKLPKQAMLNFCRISRFLLSPEKKKGAPLYAVAPDESQTSLVAITLIQEYKAESETTSVLRLTHQARQAKAS